MSAMRELLVELPVRRGECCLYFVPVRQRGAQGIATHAADSRLLYLLNDDEMAAFWKAWEVVFP